MSEMSPIFTGGLAELAHQFGNLPYMVIVMPAVKISQINYPHSLFQPGMPGALADKCLVIGLEAADEIRPRLAEFGQDVFQDIGVMTGLVRLLVAQVGGAQRVQSSFEIVQAAHGQRFQIPEMTGVFL